MGIDEGKGGIAGDGNPLGRGKRQLAGGRRRGAVAAGGMADGIQIDICTQKCGIVRYRPLEIGMLDSLDQTEMAFWQGEIAAPGQGTQHRHAYRFHPPAHQPFMAGTGHPVQDHACKRQRVIQMLETERRCSGGLGLSGHVQHQHNRPAHCPCNVRTGAIADGTPARDTIEQAHRSLGKHHVRANGLSRDCSDQAAIHGPGIEVERRTAAGGAVKSGIDIVGTALEGLDHRAVFNQRSQQAQHDRSLARSRCRSGDHQA